jgi:hypothetical protein
MTPESSVADPDHFDADPDPTSEKTRMRIRPNDADPEPDLQHRQKVLPRVLTWIKNSTTEFTHVE